MTRNTLNVPLWILQILLALHTAVGAIWKSSNPESIVPSLASIPHSVWTAMIVVELFCAIGLIAPAFNKRFAALPPIAAGLVAVEMLLFTAVHFASGSNEIGEPIYWLVVAGVCAVIIYGRLALKPIRRGELA